MKIARNLAVSGRHDEWCKPFPAPSLRELSRPKGVTEGVSSDGSSMPTIYTPAIINSEIFERLRSSGYTPSVSHSLDSSLREGAGNGLVPFNRVLAKPWGFGRFSSPLRNSEIVSFYHPSDDTPSEREPGMGWCHSTGYSLKSQVAGDFHRPYEGLYHATDRGYGVISPRSKSGRRGPGGCGRRRRR